MGNFGSKLEKNTPTKSINRECKEIEDPRSPSILIQRTPINDIDKSWHRSVERAQDLTTDICTPLKNDNHTTIFKDRLFKDLESNICDPRSPSLNIIRTPINLIINGQFAVENYTQDMTPVVEYNSESESFESALSKIDFDSFTVDEVYESNISTSVSKKKYLETNFDICIENFEPKQEDPIEQNINEIIDPRSPSLGIERTPIVFGNNNSAESTLLSTGNNQLISDGKSLISLSLPITTKIESNFNSLIYEDDKVEHSTPKVPIEGNRTPLSCLANKTKQFKKIDSKSSNLTMKNGNSIRKDGPMPLFDNKLETGKHFTFDENNKIIKISVKNRSHIPLRKSFTRKNLT